MVKPSFSNLARLRSLLLVLVAFVSAATTGCAPDRREDSSNRLKVVTTTGMIEDAVREIAGEHADVVALMGPGVDPHLYKATQGDLAQLTNADVVFYNGLHLEGKLVEALAKLARSRSVIAVTDGIPRDMLRRPPEFNGNYDPHVWFDVSLWSHAVRLIADSLAALDAAHAVEYRGRADRYRQRLDSLDRWIRTTISAIPREQRLLITAHDAFGYFGAAYDIEVRGLQGISTVSEFGLADINTLVRTIVERRVRAVFVESSVPRRSIQAVVEGVKGRGHTVAIGGTLYSDAMGARGTPEGTYVGMVSSNVRTIVNALK